MPQITNGPASSWLAGQRFKGRAWSADKEPEAAPEKLLETTAEESRCPTDLLFSASECQELSRRLASLEVSVEKVLTASSSSALFKLQQMHQQLETQVEELYGGGMAQREQMEAFASRVRSLEQKNSKNTLEIKKVAAVMERHGFASQASNISERLCNVEERCRRILEDSRRMEASVEKITDSVHSNVQRLVEAAEAKEGAAVNMEGFTSKLQALETEQQLLVSLVQSHTEALESSLGRVKDLPAQVKQMKAQAQAITKRQERCDDEVNKIQRLGRILDDKVEVFDELERRMEELTSQAQRLLGANMSGSVKCLSCTNAQTQAEESTRPRSTSRPRSPSPSVVPRVGTSSLTNLNLNHSDNGGSSPARWSRAEALAVRGFGGPGSTGSTSTPIQSTLEAAGWAPTQPPRSRPSSARSVRNAFCDSEQGQGEHPASASRGRHYNISDLAAKIVAAASPVAGAAFSACRGSASPLTSKMRNMGRRPLSARARISGP